MNTDMNWRQDYPINRGNKKIAKIPDWPKERQLQSFDWSLSMIVWVHIFTALHSALIATACYAASSNPWTETA